MGLVQLPKEKKLKKEKEDDGKILSNKEYFKEQRRIQVPPKEIDQEGRQEIGEVPIFTKERQSDTEFKLNIILSILLGNTAINAFVLLALLHVI